MRKMVQNILVLVLVTSYLTSCSTYYRSPESFKDKMSRFTANQSANGVPEIPVSNKNFSTNRLPASEEQLLDDKTKYNHSNKRLYFLTLFQQYNYFRQFSQNESPEVLACPHFHSSIVEHKESFDSHLTSKKNLNKDYLNNIDLSSEEVVAKFPLFALPITKESKFPKVIDYINKNKNEEIKEVVSKAIDIHLIKTFEELSELCEYGTSNNYYSYTNLMNSIRRSIFPPSPENMQTLLKTSLISNYALKKSLNKAIAHAKGRAPASTQNLPFYEQEVMRRMDITWAEKYFRNTLGD